MHDTVITGASRGIGRALALAIAARAEEGRLILTARDEAMLSEVARLVERSGVMAICVPGDLSTLAGARKVGAALGEVIRAPGTLVHNAGLWPTRRLLTSDGLETAFVVNCVGPLLMQQELLDRKLIGRVMVISAGLITKGRYSAEKTPLGLDFSSWRTYCNTKLAFAVAERDLARRYADIDFAVLHPGVVRTDLGARPGLLGGLVDLAKRFWERPEACADRLVRMIQRERWSPAGEARWWFESEERPWPDAAEDEATRRAIRGMVERFTASSKP